MYNGGIDVRASCLQAYAMGLTTVWQSAAVKLLQAHIQDAQATQEQIQRMGELIVALGATPELAN